LEVQSFAGAANKPAGLKATAVPSKLAFCKKSFLFMQSGLFVLG
jgi:hypothetical protein